MNQTFSATALCATLLAATNAHSQSADALINKLIEKGILTTKEGEDLRQQTGKDAAKPSLDRTPLPAWISTLRFGGDFRGRFDGIYPSDPAFVDRNRFRYRLRYGVVATMENDFEVGFRITSFDVINNAGGNPVSNNSTLQGNGTKKFLGIDLAYARWSGIRFNDLTG